LPRASPLLQGEKIRGLRLQHAMRFVLKAERQPRVRRGVDDDLIEAGNLSSVFGFQAVLKFEQVM
jgi:hypothetical protein